MCVWLFCLQLEQEMGLIVGQADVKTRFLQKWSNYVPAILSYGETSTKKSVSRHLAGLEETGKFLV